MSKLKEYYAEELSAPKQITTEVRKLDPSWHEPQLGGIKHDEGKPRLDLLPVEALEEIALVLAFGEKKYGTHQWRNGFQWSRIYGALLRHLFAFMRGEDYDKESGISHLGHMGACALFLITHWKLKLGKDDRP